MSVVRLERPSFPRHHLRLWIVVLAVAACRSGEIVGPPLGITPFDVHAVALTTGNYSTCAVAIGGAAWCWGANDHGQLGNGTLTASLVPSPVAGGLRFTQISGGGWQICGLTTEQAAYCWGEGGAVPGGTSMLPRRVGGALRFSTLGVSDTYACGLTEAGRAYCWGGPAPRFTTTPAATADVPLEVSGNHVFASLSVGAYHACGLTVFGEVYCWGFVQYLALPDEQVVTTPTRLVTPWTFLSIAAGVTTTCGIAADGEAMCWGRDYYGSLGRGLTDVGFEWREPAPVLSRELVSVRPGPSASDEAATCGLTSAGAAYCWGSNSKGQLGTSVGVAGTCSLVSDERSRFPCSGTPVPVSGNGAFLAVVPGGKYACGITTAHVMMCWGDNTYGQLGTGNTTSSLVPVAVQGGLTFP